MSTLQIKKLCPEAHIPAYASPGSAGADLYACFSEESILCEPGKTVFVHTGLAMAIPDGYVGLICARSGMACKRDLAPANKVGIIDSDYRGELIVALHNHGCTDQVVYNGERIAQLVLVPVAQFQFQEVLSLTDTERGAGGFGSTGY